MDEKQLTNPRLAKPKGLLRFYNSFWITKELIEGIYAAAEDESSCETLARLFADEFLYMIRNAPEHEKKALLKHKLLRIDYFGYHDDFE